jgi:hypothetical protein
MLVLLRGVCSSQGRYADMWNCKDGFIAVKEDIEIN